LFAPVNAAAAIAPSAAALPADQAPTDVAAIFVAFTNAGNSLDSAGELFARLERELERLDHALTEHRDRRKAA
jgi:hypothetical protein